MKKWQLLGLWPTAVHGDSASMYVLIGMLALDIVKSIVFNVGYLDMQAAISNKHGLSPAIKCDVILICIMYVNRFAKRMGNRLYSWGYKVLYRVSTPLSYAIM